MTGEKKRMSKGCMVAMIVVGALAVIVIVSGIVCYVYKDELIQAGISKMTEGIATEVKTALPEGYTAEDVDALMEEFNIAFAEEKIDEMELQELSTKFQELYKNSEEGITVEQSKEMLEMIRKFIDE